MTFRTASFPAMLRWARKATDHYMNVDTINYAAEDNSTIKGPIALGPIKSHQAGFMYHCKGLTHWGSEAFGMQRRDAHSGSWGHWVDPDALLWSWYIDGNARAKDVYDLWAGAIHEYGLPLDHARRDVNTSLAIAINYYQANWDVSVLPFIVAMGYSLRTSEPLENQNPGPLWHPLWMNRYYEQTRDPDYPEFILKYARMLQLGNTWTMSLAALAYDLSGDTTYLTARVFPPGAVSQADVSRRRRSLRLVRRRAGTIGIGLGLYELADDGRGAGQCFDYKSGAIAGAGRGRCSRSAGRQQESKHTAQRRGAGAQKRRSSV